LVDFAFGDNETSTTIQTVDKPFLKVYFSYKKKKEMKELL